MLNEKAKLNEMKKVGIEIKWGIIFSLVTLLWMWLEKSMGLHNENIEKHATLTIIFAVPAIIVYVLALLDNKTPVKKYRMKRLTQLKNIFHSQKINKYRRNCEALFYLPNDK